MKVIFEGQGLSVRGLRKEYATRGDPLVVLQNVSLELAPGEAMAIMGPSGSGKSTLLHLLGTLESPTAGTISIHGKNPFEFSEAELAVFRNREIGLVFQDHHLLPQCSALENILIPTLGPGPPGENAESPEARAMSLLDRVGLAKRRDYRPAELSGGERQRVALARSLVNRPRLILADEPTGNLDRVNAQAVADLLLELHREEETILVVVTHSLNLANRFPRRAEMLDGSLRDMN